MSKVEGWRLSPKDSNRLLFFERNFSIIPQHQRKGRCLSFQDHPTGPPHAQLLRTTTAVLRRTPMRVNKRSIQVMATLAIFITILFATSTWAAAEDTVLHSFSNNGTDGIVPDGGVIFDAAGNLYGTTWAGGTYRAGTVYELTPAAGGGWTEQVLHSFGNGADGAFSAAGLIFDTAGNLYGTTAGGGTYSNGTVFELTPAAGGTWTEQVVYSFANNGTDGTVPKAGVIFDAAGNLYGTTSQGGTYTLGALFELTPAAGGTWTEQVLHSFGNGTDGANLYAKLIFDGAGNLYGTTYQGGSYGGGTVFRFNAQGEVLL